MRCVTGILCASLLAGCQPMARLDSDSSAYRLPKGSELVLNRELNIPSGSAHVKFQHGKLSGGVDDYAVNCEFRVRDLGPQVVQPERFSVVRSGDSREWAIYPFTIRFYKTVTLESAQQTGRMYLVCQVWGSDYRGNSISLNEMREALGEYFSFPSSAVAE
jgi:hypothetical protein